MRHGVKTGRARGERIPCGTTGFDKREFTVRGKFKKILKRDLSRGGCAGMGRDGQGRRYGTSEAQALSCRVSRGDGAEGEWRIGGGLEGEGATRT